jgi:DNA primase
VLQYDNPARQSTYRGKIVIPVRRFKDWELVAYLARNPDPAEGEPKYVWPSGFHKGLEVFGASVMKEDHQLPVRVCYLVESPFTVMKFWQMGLPAISPFGWSLSPEQIAIVGELAKGIICLPDSDKAEAFAPYAHALSKKVWVRCPAMPEGVADPERLSLEQTKSLT